MILVYPAKREDGRCMSCHKPAVFVIEMRVDGSALTTQARVCAGCGGELRTRLNYSIQIRGAQS